MKYLILIAIALASSLPSAYGEEEEAERTINGYPGWTLELIKPAAEEDGSPNNYRTSYFVLKPPDKRPAASITSRIAERVKSGEMGPEAAYNGGSAESSADAKNSDSHGSSNISGFPAGDTGGRGIPIATSSPNNVYMPKASAGASAAPPAAASAPVVRAVVAGGGEPANGSGSSRAPGTGVQVDNTKGGSMAPSIMHVEAPPPPNCPGTNSPAPAGGTCPPICQRFVACVDGSDYLTIQNSKLTITHRNFMAMGSHPNCSGNLRGFGTFLLDGASKSNSADLKFKDLVSMRTVSGRGTVTQIGSDQILIDDDLQGASFVYDLEICGK